MEIQVSVHDWLSLPMLTRVKLREAFSIPKSKGSLVEGNIVKSDGTTHDDLKAITLAKLQEYFYPPGQPAEERSTDFVDLFNSVISKIEEQDKELEPEKVDPVQIILQSWTMQLGQIITQANSMNMKQHLEELLNKLLPNEQRKQPRVEPQPDKASKKAKQKRA